MSPEDPSARALAHYRAGKRYMKFGDSRKAQAHISRAMHYTDKSHFGAIHIFKLKVRVRHNRKNPCSAIKTEKVDPGVLRDAFQAHGILIGIIEEVHGVARKEEGDLTCQITFDFDSDINDKEAVEGNRPGLEQS